MSREGLRERPPGPIADRKRLDDATEAYVRRLLLDTPPLTAEDKRHLTRLLTNPRPESAA